MMDSERRQCGECGYPVTYWWIWDAHDPSPVTQFVAAKLDDDGSSGLSTVVRNCPRCKSELTLETTEEIHSET